MSHIIHDDDHADSERNNRYFEAIEYLFSSNTFVIADSRRIEYLSIDFLPQRIDAIRSLRFLYSLPSFPPLVPPGCTGLLWEEKLRRQTRWAAIWNVISTMRNLENLHVELHGIGPSWATFNKESAKVLLKPIKEVTRPTTFILTLPFSAMHEGMKPVTTYEWSARNGWEGVDPWEELPCTIRRT